MDRHLYFAVPVPPKQEQEPHLWLHVTDQLEVEQLYSVGQSGSGGKENTSLSAVISPGQGSRHPLPAERGRFSLTCHSWRWRGADGPAWPRFQPDCQGGVGRVRVLASEAGIHKRRAGGTSLLLPWGLACMRGCGDTDGGFTVVLE